MDPLRNVTSTVYDQASRAIESINPLGFVTTTTYDKANRAIAATNPESQTTSTVYDHAGRAIELIDPLWHVTTSTYDDANRKIMVTDPLGNMTSTVYDAASRAIESINPLGFITTTAYDKANRAIAVTDPNAHTTSTVYDLAGRAIAKIDPLWHVTTSVYDDANRNIAVKDANLHVTSTIYDNASRRIASVDALGFATTTAYDRANRPVSMTDPLGNVTSTVYDLAGRAIEHVDPLGNVTTSVYDYAGRKIAVKDPLKYLTSTVYDAANRAVEVINPLGFITTTSYDRADRKLSVKDAQLNVTSTLYDAAGRTVATIDGNGSITTSVYDPANRLIAIVDANTHRTSFAYDNANRKIKETNAEGGVYTLGYDPAGNLTLLLDPRSQGSTNTYDPANRRTLEVFSDAAGAQRPWPRLVGDEGEMKTLSAVASRGIFNRMRAAPWRKRRGAEPASCALTIRPVIVMPTYNNRRTLPDVLRRAAALDLPMILVDDGCTDGTPDAVRQWRQACPRAELRVLTHRRNRGKAAALRTGFAAAMREGFTHAVTIDTDAQHDPAYIPRLLEVADESPEAYVLGVRDDRHAEYPARSRTGRRISNLLIRLESGLRVHDSQCGLRVYPMELVRTVTVRAGRFGYETEIITRAAWAGCPIIEAPVNTRYLPPDQRVSHFRPVIDTLRAIRMHVRLLLRAIAPIPHRRYLSAGRKPPRRFSISGLLRWINPLRAWRELKRRELDHNEVAMALAVGVFVANLPVYPFQTVLAIYLARRLHLNPLAVLAGTQASMPPITALLIAAAVCTGHLILHHALPAWPDVHSLHAAWQSTGRPFLLDWVVGAPIVGILMGAVVFLLAHRLIPAGQDEGMDLSADGETAAPGIKDDPVGETIP